MSRVAYQVLAEAAALLPLMTAWEQREAARAAGAAVRDVAGDVGRVVQRLRFRLASAASVESPYGWLVRIGLRRSSECGRIECESAVDVVTGRECVPCRYLVEGATSRSQRRANPVEELADAAAEGTGVQERRLHNLAMHRAEAVAAAERDEAQHRLRQVTEGPEREAREASAEAARLAVPCEDCQEPQSAGLCLRCASRRGTHAAIVETVNLRLAVTTPTCWDDVRAVVDRVNAEITGQLIEARHPGADRYMIAASDRVNAETYRDQARQRALEHWALSATANEEAELVSAAELRRTHGYETRSDAEKAAFEAGERARLAAARKLLEQRLRFVRSLRQPHATSLRSPHRGLQECS
ncbi:hypothetical protein ACFXI0_09935 [Kitasatospora indigofera]|uniref:hypothetical protein n=1 Tax=Kitasatospora indigofera TaxID=67307 RepID=UPI0036C26ADF